MKTYSLTLALLISLGGSSVWAQTPNNTAPQKIVAEVSSTTPAGAKSLGANHPPTKPAGKAETNTAKPKPSTPETTVKPKPPTAAQPGTETKTETKLAGTQAPGIGTEVKSEASALPFKLNDRTESLPPAPSLTSLLLRTFGALLFIVGLIAAVGWGLRYFGIVSFGKAQNETTGLKVTNTLPLGERRSLLTVKFGDRTLLIGATPQGLALLAEQPDEVGIPGNYMPMPGMQTVTDLLGNKPGYQFEDELAQATIADNTWRNRSTR